jgi:hypothetical protein
LLGRRRGVNDHDCVRRKEEEVVVGVMLERARAKMEVRAVVVVMQAMWRTYALPKGKLSIGRSLRFCL